jgi:hypothetical protein
MSVNCLISAILFFLLLRSVSSKLDPTKKMTTMMVVTDTARLQVHLETSSQTILLHTVKATCNVTQSMKFTYAHSVYVSTANCKYKNDAKSRYSFNLRGDVIGCSSCMEEKTKNYESKANQTQISGVSKYTVLTRYPKLTLL